MTANPQASQIGCSPDNAICLSFITVDFFTISFWATDIHMVVVDFDVPKDYHTVVKPDRLWRMVSFLAFPQDHTIRNLLA
jgi:hypothetical protein